jgi:hypothetical protein
MRAARLAFVERYAGRPWWTRALLERARGGHLWDELRAEQRAGRRRAAARHAVGLVVDPRRLAGALEMLWYRRQVRARSADVG